MKGFHLALAALALTGTGVQGAEGLRYGVQVALVAPTSNSLKDITDRQMGYSLGGQVTWDWKEGQVLRGRVDYTAFPRYTVEYRGINTYKIAHTVAGISGGVDYLYFWSGRAEGLYLTGGITISSWGLDAKYSGDLNGTVSRGKTGPGVAGGLGWQFTRNLGVELRGTYSQWDALNSKDNTATTFGVEAAWRF